MSADVPSQHAYLSCCVWLLQGGADGIHRRSQQGNWCPAHVGKGRLQASAANSGSPNIGPAACNALGAFVTAATAILGAGRVYDIPPDTPCRQVMRADDSERNPRG